MNEATKQVMSMNDAERSALYKKAFDGVEGELLLEDLRVRCFVYDNPGKPVADGLVGSGLDTSFNCGMLSVVQHIESNINYQPMKEVTNEG